MGFRSTLCSEHYPGELPEWFKEKYNQIILFPAGLLVVSKSEAKYYTNDFFEDYQKAVKQSGFWEDGDLDISLAVLAEDGVISNVVITKDNIKYFCMQEAYESNHVWQQG